MPEAWRGRTIAVLLACLPTLARGAPKPLSPEEKLRQTAAAVLKRVPHVQWRPDQTQIGDVTWHQSSDVVALGTLSDAAVIAIIPGPVTRASQPMLLRFYKPKSEHPRPEDFCGDPGELTLSLEPPGVKPADLKCAGKRMTPDCQKVLDTEVRLQHVRARRGLGIKLSGGKCPPLHIFFDGARFQSWRDDAAPGQ